MTTKITNANITNTGVSAGSYTNTNLTVNAQGQITAASNGTGGGGTPGGSDTQVQFNDAGSFGGDAGLTYNKTTDVLTVAGAFSAPAGSASAPSITTTGDTNTGVYFPGADSVAITTGGTAAVTVDSGQRTKFPTTIGIGNATPSTSGSGITFPATQSASTNANTLDDYEEGTWTPVLQDSGANQATMTLQQGFYTKIGNVVYAWCQVAYSSKTAMTGTWYAITGLPFTAKANSAGYYYGGVVQSDTSTSNAISILPGGESKFLFAASNLYTLQQVSALSASGRIIVTATYVV